MWPHHYRCGQPSDGDRCKLNMWSPVNCRPQDVEDVAFSCYVKHQSELDDIVQDIVDNPWLGEVNLDGLDDFGPNDLKYIQNELYKRGIISSLSLKE